MTHPVQEMHFVFVTPVAVSIEYRFFSFELCGEILHIKALNRARPLSDAAFDQVWHRPCLKNQNKASATIEGSERARYKLQKPFLSLKGIMQLGGLYMGFLIIWGL